MNTLGGIKALPQINTWFSNPPFVKHRNGTLGGSNFYLGCMEVIKVSAFREFGDQPEILTAVSSRCFH
jgi:hypothetical protein